MKHHKNKETSGCMENPEKKSFKKIVDAKVYKSSSKIRKKKTRKVNWIEIDLHQSWVFDVYSEWVNRLIW